MKKLTIALAALMVAMTIFSSCTTKKRCRGGGWYGKRNLSSIEKAPAQHKANTLEIQTTEEELANCK